VAIKKYLYEVLIMTLDQKITPIKNDLTDPPSKIMDFQERRNTFFRKFKRDRRKHKRDRRRSVRGGVIVNLSFRANRRKGTNRRTLQTRMMDFIERKKSFFRKFKRDKRKHKRDRRRSVRDGVIVNLSFRANRRKGPDRRTLQPSF
jgi:hypothetical protein